jgi:hypothetical protein
VRARAAACAPRTRSAPTARAERVRRPRARSTRAAAWAAPRGRTPRPARPCVRRRRSWRRSRFIDSGCSGGGKRIRELRFYCDPSLVTSHNGIELSDCVREYLKGLGELAFAIGFSAPHTQAGRLFALMNVNLHRSHSGTVLCCEMLISAAVHIAAQPQPGSKAVERRERSPSELYHGKRFAADAVIGFPGQCAHAWLPGQKASRGVQRSEPCLCLRPSEASAGFVVLPLRNGNRKDCFHVVMVDAVEALPLMLAWNDKVCRPGGGRAV